jgi:hypothetical protein
MVRRWLAAAVGAGLLCLVGTTALAQRGRWYNGPRFDPMEGAPPPPPYDGQYTFARLKFTTGPGGYYYRGLPAWAHGYPKAETNLTKILKSVTDISVRVDGSRVVAIDDPALFEYPLVYATEAGFLVATDREVALLRAYILKGGFIIIDDFRGYDWQNFEALMRRVVPGEQAILLDIKHPIFHSFFDIATLEFVQAYDRGTAQFYGFFPDNNQAKPMQLIANYNNDVSEYWEFSDTGFAPIALSNEAYKLGVNYIVYGLTH